MRKSSTIALSVFLFALALSAGAQQQSPHYVCDGKTLQVVNEDLAPAKVERWQVWLYEDGVRIPRFTAGLQYSRWGLIVGKITFRVRDRYVWRLPDSINPECGYNETCCYSVHKGMPREEEIAIVLLQLKNNPALFDKWVRQSGLAFKADGQVFTRAQ